MSSVDELVGALAREGQQLSQGEFVLDRDKAREKMSKFQLSDPYHYVLELVQAAHLLNAQAIRFDIDADELELILEGEALNSLSAQQLEQVYSAAFMRQQDSQRQALRHFGIALGAIGALHPQQVELVSVDGEQVHVLTQRFVRGAAVEQVSTRARVEEQGLRFYVRERFRFGHLVEFVSKHASSPLPEIALLRDAASMSMIPITINGELVHDGRWLEAGASRGIKLELEGLHGWVQLDLELSHMEVSVGQRGVWISTHILPSPLPFGGRVRALSSTLSKDLSQRAFVQDESWHKLMDTLEDGLCAAAALWLSSQDLHAEDERRDALLRATFELVSARRRQGLAIGPGLMALGLECERLPAWRCADAVVGGGDGRRLLPLRDFGVSLATPEQPLYYALVHVPELRLPASPQVLLKVSDQLHRVRAYLGGKVRALDVTSALLSARERRERQQRLLQQLMFMPLDPEQWPVQVTLTSERFSDAKVNVGWSPVRWRSGFALFHRLRLLDASEPRRAPEIISPDEDAGDRPWRWSDPHQLWSSSENILQAGIKVQLVAELPTNDVLSKPDMLSERFGELCLLILEALSALMVRRFEQAAYEPEELKTFVALIAHQQAVDEVLSQLGWSPRVAHDWMQVWRAGVGLETIWAASYASSVEARLRGLGVLATLPLFETIEGARLSLRELAAIARGQLIAVWSDGPLASKRAQLRALEVVSCLWIDKRDAWLLNKLLEPGHFTVREDHLGARLARAEFLAKPLWRAPDRGDDELVELSHERDGIRATLRMINPHHRVFARHQEQLALMEVIHEQRALCELEVELPFGLFMGEVEVEGLQCLSSYDGIVQDARWHQAREVITEAAAQAWRRWVEVCAAAPFAQAEPSALWLLWQLHAWSRRAKDPLQVLTQLERSPMYRIKRLGEGAQGVVSEQWVTREQLVLWASRQERVLTLRRGAHVEAAAPLEPGLELLEVFEPVAASHEVLGELLEVRLSFEDVWQLLDEQARLDAAKRHFMVQAPMALKLQAPQPPSIYVPVEETLVRGYIVLKPVGPDEAPVDELTLCFEARRAHEVKGAGSWLVFGARVVLDSAQLIDFTRSALPDEQVSYALKALARREILRAVDERLREPEQTLMGLRWLSALLSHGQRRRSPEQRELLSCLSELPLLMTVAGEACYRELEAKRARLCWTWRQDHELGGLSFDAHEVLRPPSPEQLSVYRELFEVLPELRASTIPTSSAPRAPSAPKRMQAPPAPPVRATPVVEPARAQEEDSPALPAPAPLELDPDEAFIAAERQWWARRWVGLKVAMPQRMNDVAPVYLGRDGVLARVHEGQAQLNMEHLVVTLARSSADEISRYMLMMGIFSAINSFEEPITDEDELMVLDGLITQLLAIERGGLSA